VAKSKSAVSDTVIEAPVILRVRRTVKVGGKGSAEGEDSEKIIEIRKFVTEPAHVRFSYPIKKSLEFQAAGIEIGVDIPCYREEISDGMKEAIELVVTETAELLPEIDSVLDRLVEQALEAKVSIARGTWKPGYSK